MSESDEVQYNGKTYIITPKYYPGQLPNLDVPGDDWNFKNFVRGLYYGYPMCCVLYFCATWDSARINYSEKMFTGPKGDEHNMCPECIWKELQK